MGRNLSLDAAEFEKAKEIKEKIEEKKSKRRQKSMEDKKVVQILDSQIQARIEETKKLLKIFAPIFKNNSRFVPVLKPASEHKIGSIFYYDLKTSRRF
jgi:hypothetical protein